jgi:hypothetical protein
MKDVFPPSWGICLDESMVKWLNEYAPGWMAVGRKPSPFGNEYHTIACGVLHIIFWMECVEGKSRPPHLEEMPLSYEHGKLCALILRATEAIAGSNRVVFMDSGYGVLCALPELRRRGLHATVVLKKKKFWAKGLPGEAILEAVRMTPVGTTKALVGTMRGHKLWVGVQVDSKHTTIMANTWSTTQRNGEMKKRLVGGRLCTFKYCDYQNHYFWARHYVDDHSHNRSACVPLEDAVNTKSWSMRQSMFLDAVCEVNALLAFNYWCLRPKGQAPITNRSHCNGHAQ